MASHHCRVQFCSAATEASATQHEKYFSLFKKITLRYLIFYSMYFTSSDENSLIPLPPNSMLCRVEVFLWRLNARS